MVNEKDFACIISLSRRDPRFTDETLDGVRIWLLKEKKSGEPYLFHKVKPRRVRANSRLFFSFEAQLFGKAVAKKDIEKIPDEIQKERERRNLYVYKHSMVIASEPIDLFPELVLKRDIERKLKINCDRPFRYLTRTEYNQILKMAKLPPE